MRKEWRLIRRKENIKTRPNFFKDPYKFAKSLFSEVKNGKLKCTKQELESHLKATYWDPKRNEELPNTWGLKKPSQPGKRSGEFVWKVRKAVQVMLGWVVKFTWNVLFWERLFLLWREACQKNTVAELWQLAEGIYLPEEEIGGKIFGIIGKAILDYERKNGYINESAQEAGLPKIPGCVEHAYSIWSKIQETENRKENLSVIWLDLAKAYGSVPHRLLERKWKISGSPKN